MADLEQLKKSWLRPFFFYGNNPTSLIGGALTTASAMILIGFWVIGVLGHGGSKNPYVGIIVDLILPAIFVLGLILIPIGIYFRHRHLVAVGEVPAAYPEIDLNSPTFRHGINVVVVATFINFVIVGTASYRGVAYMDTPSFCGQACHVMAPEWTAYHESAHSGVACTECHIASGFPGYVHAKVNGTQQLLMVLFHDYPRPIMAGGKIPPASATCFKCHNPNTYTGDKLVVKTTFGDDEKNTMARTVVVMHVGGRDQFGHLSGIHGAHLGHIEYISTDSRNQTIPWVRKINANGSIAEFDSSGAKGPPKGKWHTMDCIDCHNRPAHSFYTPEQAVDRDMVAGSPSPSLPFVHKEGLALIKATYSSQTEAASKITSGLDSFYRTQYPQVWNGQRAQVNQAAKTLVAIYDQNVFPFMKITWGTHHNNLLMTGGCFRCHDGSHSTKAGKTLTNDCTVCHNLVAFDESNPKQLAALGMQ
ncbi:MAG TPA: NapC/NirT family cytochrome c [Acidobacteriaceae bacterium]|nr:NapC/NirT family cytochrome c [Acidobacteriaceae bacterium]